MNETLKPYISLCDAIGKLFYPNVEVVLHDLKTKRLVHIVNAFSKRRAGDVMVSDGAIPEAQTWIGPYDKTNEDGKALKAVTMLIRDTKDVPVGMLCINYNIEPAKALLASLHGFLHVEEKTPPPSSFFSQNWKEHTDEQIAHFLNTHNVALQGLSSSEKRELVYYLNEQGTFAIRNVVGYLCGVLSVSRATIYNWLKQQRQT
jgi:predicted transcriptional regulator YheO